MQMEEICNALSALLCQSGTGGYKIYYEEELLEAIPEDVRNRETLEAAMKNLAEGGFVDVKYARGSAFCVAALKRYEKREIEDSEPEIIRIEEPAPSPAFNLKRACAAMALFSFLGGAIGGTLAAVLGAVL